MTFPGCPEYGLLKLVVYGKRDYVRMRIPCREIMASGGKVLADIVGRLVKYGTAKSPKIRFVGMNNTDTRYWQRIFNRWVRDIAVAA